MCFAVSGCRWNPDLSQQDELGICPSQRACQIPVHNHSLNYSPLGQRQMTTDSFLSPLNIIECRARPMAAIAQIRAPGNLLSQNNCSPIHSISNIRKLSTVLHPFVPSPSDPIAPAALLLRHDFSAAAGTETSFFVNTLFNAPSYCQSNALPPLHSDRSGERSSSDLNLGFLPKQEFVKQSKQTALQEPCTLKSEFFKYNKGRITYSKLLKREYCLFRVNHLLKEATSRSTVSWANAERTFFKKWIHRFNLHAVFQEDCRTGGENEANISVKQSFQCVHFLHLARELNSRKERWHFQQKSGMMKKMHKQ